ncbi:hypothetical protein [Halomonas cerina]|uniref:Transcriptional regulator n=1 Tax=Halomonas cerina TaxID=447424 RepID=A0A839V9E6_9GAMM|nr:hypothetical protein [Halomonas cerina]MBB3192072.1 hypothetical protein [Halomonas cerina]
MKLAEYLRELDQPGADGHIPLEQFAERAGTTVGYLRVHVIRARKPASLRYMRRLAQASEGKVSLLDVLRHYGVTDEELDMKARAA